MKPRSHTAAAIAGFLALVATAAAGRAGGKQPPAPAAPRTWVLLVAKPRVVDPPGMQRRGIAAVAKLEAAVNAAFPGARVDALAEGVITPEQFRRGGVTETVTGEIFRKRLEALAATAGPDDTVVIYTHSHGRQNGFEAVQPLGGIVVDLPVRRLEHAGTLLWDEYAELLLAIPARNVVVLTMSCFAGGLVEHLESESVAPRWRNRRMAEARNLVVLTSQNAELKSEPIGKDGELVNPFTFAVAQGFAGAADGFVLPGGEPAPPGAKDGELSIGELIDFVLHATEHTRSEVADRPNTAKPCVTGSFDRTDILSRYGAGGGRTGTTPGTTEDDSRSPR